MHLLIQIVIRYRKSLFVAMIKKNLTELYDNSVSYPKNNPFTISFKKNCYSLPVVVYDKHIARLIILRACERKQDLSYDGIWLSSP